MQIQTKRFPVKRKPSNSTHRHPLVVRVLNLIQKESLLTKDDRVIVAVSGGPDSTALLHLLSVMEDIYSTLFAIYIDHGLRPGETDAEIKLLENFCAGLHIDLEISSVDVRGHQRRTGSSLEESARNLRYAALESARIRHEASVIAVAHTADDQVEEMLLRLIRGTGREGLSGMTLKRNTIVRPLLEEKKQSLVDYLNENSISYCLDSSNSSRRFLRNRVRLDLLPNLEKEFNPSIRTNLLQTAEILRMEEDLLQKISQEAYARLAHTQVDSTPAQQQQPITVKIEIRSFLDMHPAIQRRILEKVFWKMRTTPGFRQIDSVRDMIASGCTGAEIHLGGGLRVWKMSREVVFSHPGGRKNYRGSGIEEVTISVGVEGPGSISVAGHRLYLRLVSERPTDIGYGELLLDADQLCFPLLVRRPRPGEKFKPLGSAGTKKISRYLSDAKVPRQSRQFFPVLVSEGKIAAIIGLRIDHDFRVQEDTRHFAIIGWQRITASCA